MYMSVLPSRVSVHHMYAWQHQRPEEDAGILHGKLSYWCQKLDLTLPLEEQVFLISPVPVLKYKKDKRKKEPRKYKITENLT